MIARIYAACIRLSHAQIGCRFLDMRDRSASVLVDHHAGLLHGAAMKSGHLNLDNYEVTCLATSACTGSLNPL